MAGGYAEGVKVLAHPVDNPPPSGVLSGRPWRLTSTVSEEIVTRIRPRVPLDFQVSDFLLHVLASRGVTENRDLEQYFYPSLDHLHDPFLLAEMDRAVDRMFQAARDGERVLGNRTVVLNR